MKFDLSEIRALVRIATQKTGLPLNDEDLDQEATLKAVEAFRRQFEIRYPRAFLRKIVTDAVRDHWRKRRATEELDAVDERHLAYIPHFEDELDRRSQSDLLRRALDRLDAKKRRALDLFYVEECSVAEIARLQKKSISAVKMDLFRARRLLSEIIGDLARKKRR